MLKKGSRKQNKSKTHRKPLLLTPWSRPQNWVTVHFRSCTHALLHNFISNARSFVATNCRCGYCHCDITMLFHIGLCGQCADWLQLWSLLW